MADLNDFDVIIIGGSYAGLSAAMALGRSLRNVLVIDSGLPCNQQTPHSHNFITQDGETPGAITEKARVQVSSYPTVKLLDELVVQAKESEKGFTVTTQKGQRFNAKKLIFATGVKDKIPAIKGFAECWGVSVIHCPYCHGYEFRNQSTAIMANEGGAFHLASLVNNLTKNVTILTNGRAEFNDEQKGKFRKHNITIVETKVSEILHEDGHVKFIIFKDGKEVNFNAVYAVLPFTQHSDIPASLGCQLTDHGYIMVDGFQKTNIDGVFACGDNTGMMRSIANAVYSGNLTGAMVNKELSDEQF